MLSKSGPLSLLLSRSLFTSSCRHTGKSYALTYKSFGDPLKVVEKSQFDKYNEGGNLRQGQIVVEFLASPINPADINTIQGVYAVKPPLPALAGNEGVARVVDVYPVEHRESRTAHAIRAGDWVVPSAPGFGTWRSHAIGLSTMFTKIRDAKEEKDLDPLTVSQLTVNPCTAYRMLTDFVRLDRGDSVIQNGANSGVGINVIQLAKLWGIRSLNVIRSRPEDGHLKVIEELKSLGADYVVTEEQLRDQELMSTIFRDLPKPKLALNCIGGKNATDCMRHLDQEGTMVTYGGMSKMPVAIPTGALIFKDQKFRGFWMTRWHMSRASNDPERISMMSYLVDKMKRGELKPPKIIPYELKDWKQALDHAMNPGHVDGKVVLVFNELD